jgi:deoxyadenosine/deoxycytidine kinase
MLTCCGFLIITAALVFAFYFSIYTFLNQKVKKHRNIWRERNNISDQALILETNNSVYNNLIKFN